MPSTTRQGSTAPSNTPQTSQRRIGRRPAYQKKSVPIPSFFAPSTPVITVPRLLALPAELQKDILDYITTSPYLYRHIELTPASLVQKVQDALCKSNTSLQHVRRLVIRKAPFARPAMTEAGFAVLSSVLTALPKDGLEMFAIHAGTANVPCDLDYLLRLRQRRSNLYQMQCAETCPVLHLLPDADELRNVTTLQLTLRNKESCARAQTILQAAPMVINLAIELSCTEWLTSDGPKTGELVVNTLFDQQDIKIGSQKSQKPALQKLRLSRMDLTTAGTILPTLVDCGSLRHLQLVDCDNMVPLCESFSQLRLPLEILEIKDASDGDRRGKTDVLLQSVRQLRRFRITRSVYDDPNHDFQWAALQRHAATLQVLEIVDGESDGNVFRANTVIDRSAAALRKLFVSCTDLRQLCIGGFGLESGTWTNQIHGVNLLLDCVSNLRNLRTLKLRMYPDCLDGSIYIESEERQTIFEAQIRHHAVILASKVFQELGAGCPRLRVVVVEAWEMPQDDSPEYFATFAFLRASQTDVYGCTRAVAVEEPMHLIKHHEPCSDILEPERFMGN
ncbi:hypothetical protein B0A48_13512 [Cryoendolithus antarcticus]|uniref:F-box domain-containing protein n=1 Tax=Cryoendolithus antarcticus TaxID=1507870 RepID=A0A1V8SNT9_9PEZI|nr:hypothetical protein B0A48_13512 [Cryoendolithus antarcticus]